MSLLEGVQIPELKYGEMVSGKQGDCFCIFLLAQDTNFDDHEKMLIDEVEKQGLNLSPSIPFFLSHDSQNKTEIGKKRWFSKTFIGINCNVYENEEVIPSAALGIDENKTGYERCYMIISKTK